MVAGGGGQAVPGGPEREDVGMAAPRKTTEIKFVCMNASTRCQFRVLKLMWVEGTGFQIFRWTEKGGDIYEEPIETIGEAMKKWEDAVLDNMGDGFMLYGEG